MSKNRYISKPKTNNCIINVAIGDFYISCQKRLIESAKNFCNADIMTWADEYPLNSPTHKEKPYAFKPYAFMVAKKLGYKNILWLDSIIEIEKPIDSIFTAMLNKGYFFTHNGWPLGEWIKDEALEFFSITRDIAMTYVDSSANIMGINVESDTGYSFLEEWFCISRNTDLFCGSRNNTDFSNSKDERCKGHRHDQSIAALISIKMKLDRHPVSNFLSWQGKPKDEIVHDTPFVSKRYL